MPINDIYEEKRQTEAALAAEARQNVEAAARLGKPPRWRFQVHDKALFRFSRRQQLESKSPKGAGGHVTGQVC